MATLPSKKILTNKVKCGRCNEIIESSHRHDWVQCSCKGTFVDGGKDYLRRGFSEFGFEELSTYEEKEINNGSIR